MKEESRISHFLFECREVKQEDRNKVKEMVEQEEKKTREDQERRGAKWRGSRWGKSSVLQWHPAPIMQLILLTGLATAGERETEKHEADSEESGIPPALWEAEC